MMGKYGSLKGFKKLFILFGFMLLLTLMSPNSFLKVENLSNVLWSVSVVGIMVSGTVFVILTGGIDLSVGSVLAFTGIILVKTIRFFNYSNAGFYLGVILALAAGIFIGLVHGLIITKYQVPPFLITFAASNILFGLSMLITNNKILSCLEPKILTFLGTGKVLGLPVPIFIMCGIALFSYYVLNKRIIGRYVYAVGGNQEASRFCGISDKGIIIMAYVVSGITAATGGIVLAAMTQQAMASTGKGYETEVITAAVIGGISLSGGDGTVQGALFGAVFVGLLNNGMNLLNVPSTHHGLVKGAAIILAVAIDLISHEGKRKRFFAALLPKRT